MSRSTRTTKTRESLSSFSRRRFLCAGAAALGSALLPVYSSGAHTSTPRISTTDLGGLKLFQGAGCNVIAMRGEDGALMIDGGLRANADALLKAVRDATGNSRIQHADQHALASGTDRRERSRRPRRRRDHRAREDEDVPEQHGEFRHFRRPPCAAARIRAAEQDDAHGRFADVRRTARSITATCLQRTPTAISMSTFPD